MKPGSAKFSEPDKLRRFELIRDWSDEPRGTLKTVNFIMINPSIATGEKPDQTVTRCIGYAKDHWKGFSRLVVTNLIPIVEQYTVCLPPWSGIDMENREYVQKWLKEADSVIVAWGDHPKKVERTIGLAKHIAEFLKIAPEKDLHCIAVAPKSRRPRHPSRAPYTDAPIPWKWEG